MITPDFILGIVLGEILGIVSACIVFKKERKSRNKKP